MSQRKQRGPTICVNCENCMERRGPPPRMCRVAVFRSERTNYVTGKTVPAIYKYCGGVNKHGRCNKYRAERTEP